MEYKVPKNRIAYFYDEEVGNFSYGNHPMKPIRIRMTHSLILAYGIHNHFLTYRPKRATVEEMMEFHSPGYINFLKTASTNNTQPAETDKYLSGDCPVFDNMYTFFAISAGGGLSAARRMNAGLCDISINWAGGLHHARKSQANGFCYVADCVLAIMELLKYNPRVMYIDIDIHHGDGVEDAFFDSDRVLTCSFHKYGKDFFPQTGHVYDIGDKLGKYYSVNVPLQSGMNDAAYHKLFKPIISKLIEFFRPTAILLQCGADSLVGDQLGDWNLSTRGHGECINFVKSFGIPLLVCGGGGYTKENVARCWTYESSVIVNKEIEDQLPETEYYEYFQEGYSSYKLHLHPDKRITNTNNEEFLNNIMMHIDENIKHLLSAPSVQLQELPPRAAVQNYVRRIPSSSNNSIFNRLYERIMNIDDIHEAKEQQADEEFNDQKYREAMINEKRYKIQEEKPEEGEVDTEKF